MGTFGTGESRFEARERLVRSVICPQSRAVLSSLADCIDGLSQPIYVASVEGEILFSNQAASSLTDFEPSLDPQSLASICPGPGDKRSRASSRSEHLLEVVQPVRSPSGDVLAYMVSLEPSTCDLAIHAELMRQKQELEQQNRLLEEQTEELDRRAELMVAYSTELRLALSAVEANALATVQALTAAVDARDPHTAGHSFRVSQYAATMAKFFPGATAEDLRTIEMGALLHDIGKIGVPDRILGKTGPLTETEYDSIKQHPLTGYNILSGAPGFDEILKIVRNHHERLDGTGYPDGLAGDQIGWQVRCVTLADVFDALTTARPYRPAMAEDAALAIIAQEVERGWWDERFFEIFRELHHAGQFTHVFSHRPKGIWGSSSLPAA